MFLFCVSAHVMQMMFLVFVEEPHIRRLYGQETSVVGASTFVVYANQLTFLTRARVLARTLLYTYVRVWEPFPWATCDGTLAMIIHRWFARKLLLLEHTGKFLDLSCCYTTGCVISCSVFSMMWPVWANIWMLALIPLGYDVSAANATHTRAKCVCACIRVKCGTIHSRVFSKHLLSVHHDRVLGLLAPICNFLGYFWVVWTGGNPSHILKTAENSRLPDQRLR